MMEASESLRDKILCLDTYLSLFTIPLRGMNSGVQDDQPAHGGPILLPMEFSLYKEAGRKLQDRIYPIVALLMDYFTVNEVPWRCL
jgi:hypothetical protein